MLADSVLLQLPWSKEESVVCAFEHVEHGGTGVFFRCVLQSETCSICGVLMMRMMLFVLNGWFLGFKLSGPENVRDQEASGSLKQGKIWMI